MTSKVFISYSWSSPQHEDWVLLLAKRLVDDGIDTVLDKWDLKLGHDKYAFMESMVKSEDINKVLIILDEKYTNKANERDGGVGTETMIISPNVYQNSKQEKFIPIVTEFDLEGNAYIPTYLTGRVYINFSKEENFEENYEKLVRTILNRPSSVKPKLGNLPKYITEDSPVTYKTGTLLRSFDYQIEKHPNRINLYIKDFLDAFFENLKDFKIESTPSKYTEVGKVIVENLSQFIPLRNDYIDFIKKLSRGEDEWDADILLNLFERLTILFYPENNDIVYNAFKYDNFKFITYELFIYTVAVFLENEQYCIIDNLLNSKYFVRADFSNGTIAFDYSYFHTNLEWIRIYYENLEGRKTIDPFADLLIKRIPNNVNKTSFINGDLLCFYLATFSNSHWYPRTYIYKDTNTKIFPFFNRLISRKHFEKVKSVFQVEEIDELKVKLNKIKEENKDNIINWEVWSTFTRLEDLIKFEIIGTSK